MRQDLEKAAMQNKREAIAADKTFTCSLFKEANLTDAPSLSPYSG